jgi:hypothetical protein
VVAGHLSDGAMTKISEFAVKGHVSLLASKGILGFRLPPYNPSGERMAAISWNPSSFCFAIFLLLFPLEFLGLA